MTVAKTGEVVSVFLFVYRPLVDLLCVNWYDLTLHSRDVGEFGKTVETIITPFKFQSWFMHNWLALSWSVFHRKQFHYLHVYITDPKIETLEYELSFGNADTKEIVVPHTTSIWYTHVCTFKIKIESQNLEYRCTKDQWPYSNQYQDAKPQSGTSSVLQSPKWGLKGHVCSLHLQNQDREPKFGICVYQRPVTISKSISGCQTPVRNLQRPPKPQMRT